MTNQEKRNTLAVLLWTAVLALCIFGVLALAHSQTRITPKVVCERNGAGWVYVPATNQCYGPGTHAPEPSTNPWTPAPIGFNDARPVAHEPTADVCGYPAVLHKDGRCHQEFVCRGKGARVTWKRTYGGLAVECSWQPNAVQPKKEK